MSVSEEVPPRRKRSFMSRQPNTRPAAPRRREPQCALPAGDSQPDRAAGQGARRLIRPKRGRSSLARQLPTPRLYTATIIYADGSLMIQAFHASVAHHHAQVVQRLRSRFGEDVVAIAELRCGFFPATPIAAAIVPPAVADMIREIERNCTDPSALAFAVDIEQRIEI